MHLRRKHANLKVIDGPISYRETCKRNCVRINLVYAQDRCGPTYYHNLTKLCIIDDTKLAKKEISLYYTLYNEQIRNCL